MKLHLPVRLFRALAAAALATVTTTGIAEAGVIRNDVALQQYKDFAMNVGQYRAGAQNIVVYDKNGNESVIPLMPNLDSYCSIWVATGGNGNGGGGLIAPQYVATAAHLATTTLVEDTRINFLTTSGDPTYYRGITYHPEGQTTYGYDGMTLRLNKIVTEVSYTPICTDTALISSLSSGGTLIYRIGNGTPSEANWAGGGNPSILPGSPIGGTMLAASVTANHSTKGNWRIRTTLRKDFTNPLGIGVDAGDSGSPIYIYNENTQQFETVGLLSTGTVGKYGYGNSGNWEYNPGAIESKIDFFTDQVALGDSGATVTWGAQAEDGTGMLTRGEETLWTYTGHNATDSNTVSTKGLLFSSTAEGTQRIELAGDIDMGAGSIGFENGRFELASQEGQNYRILDSAGFIVNKDAYVTFNLNGQGEEWRIVSEGIVEITGTGDNNATLNVGGGNMRFDAEGNIIRQGEVRLNREGGYAATSITLSAGVSSIVLMADNQINGNNFAFGNMGGLLNLNGHNLEWSAIQYTTTATSVHSEYGATIGNIRLVDATAAPAEASFTYTGTGSFLGAFTDGGSAEQGLLKVVYRGASAASQWTLGGTSDNAGGYEVESGQLRLEGWQTWHSGDYAINRRIAGDYTWATLQTGTVTVKNGAAFEIGHHAQMQGDVVVEEGGSFLMQSSVSATEEYVSGSQVKQDVTGRVSLQGNVALNGESARMQANITSVVPTTYSGSISGSGQFEKTGEGTLYLNGTNDFSGTKTITAGEVIFGSIDSLGTTTENQWLIAESGMMSIAGSNAGLEHIDGSSTGVYALSLNQEQQLDLSGHSGIFIGAIEGQTIEYGTEGTSEELAAANGVWRLGGGGGTLNVHFRLTGEHDLMIGNAASSGTVYLSNESNDFSGDIIIGGLDNLLEYSSLKALGAGRINVGYGNSINAESGDGAILDLLREGSSGVLALSSADGVVSHDLSQADHPGMALGAVGEVRYTGTLTPDGDDQYTFGGNGHLVLDTSIGGTGSMSVDAQGLSGGRVELVRANSFSGTVVVGGRLAADYDDVAVGSIDLVLGHGQALGRASSVSLEEGGNLVLSGADVTVNNLTAAAGASIRNEDAQTRVLTLNNASDTTLAAGALAAGEGRLDLVKVGSGTVSLAGSNNGYAGNIIVREGTLRGYSYTSTNSSFGTQAAGNSIVVEQGGTLDVTLQAGFRNVTDAPSLFTNSCMFQSITGEGTVVVRGVQRTHTASFSFIQGLPPVLDPWATGQTVIAFNQSEAFNGTVLVAAGTKSGGAAGGTRLVIGKGLQGLSNVEALNSATIEVESGSQAVVTNRMDNTSAYNGVVTSEANFVLNGDHYTGGTADASGQSGKVVGHGIDYVGNGNNAGALRVDCGSIVAGTVTLNADSTISSWSGNSTNYVSAYGTGAYLGGTIMGEIHGEGRRLQITGNQQICLRADAANSYGDLLVNNSKALRVGYGAAESQHTTALGTGTVTMEAGKVLNFANAETADTGIVYTYENDFVLKAGSRLYAEKNTTSLTGTLSMTGGSVTVGSSADAVLRLENGIAGSGTVTQNGVGMVVLGGDAETFSGTYVAGETGSLTLGSASALGGDTLDYSASTSFNLYMGAADTTYTLGVLSGAAPTVESGEIALATTSAPGLSIHYDFTTGTSNGSTLSVESFENVSASIVLDVNTIQKLNRGEYTLISGDVTGADFSLANDFSGRATLLSSAEGLVLMVGDDSRLYWQGGINGSWDSATANWQVGGEGDALVYADGAGIVFGQQGAQQATVTLTGNVSPDAILVCDGSEYSFTGEGSVSGSMLTVTDGATLNLQTASNSFGSGVTVVDGTLNAQASGALTASAVSLEEGGTLIAGTADALGTGSTVTFNGGTFRFGADDTTIASGTFKPGSGAIHLDVNGHSGIQLVGDAAINASAYVFSNSASNAGAVSLGQSDSAFSFASGASFAIGQNVTVTNYCSGGTISALSGEGNFTISNTGVATIADISGFAGTLTKAGSANLTISTLSGSNSLTLNLGSNTTTITNMSGFAGTITRMGSGALTVGTKSAEATWVLQGGGYNATDFNTFAADTNTVILRGFGGSGTYLGNGNYNYVQEFVLESYGSTAAGITINNGFSSKVYTFEGRVSGSGSFVIARSGKSVADSYVFSGDLSSFSGGFDITQKSSVADGIIKLTDNGGKTSYANNEQVAGTGNIRLAITTPGTNTALVLDYDADHGMSNTISGTGNIAKRGAGTLTCTGDMSGHTGSLAVEEGRLRIAGEKGLAHGGLSLTTRPTLARTTSEDLVLELEDVLISSNGTSIGQANEGRYGAISNARVVYGSTARAALTVSGIDLDNTVLVNESAQNVTLSDVYINGNSSVSAINAGTLSLDACTLNTGESLLASTGSGYAVTLGNLSNASLLGSFTLDVSAVTMNSISAAGNLGGFDFILQGTSMGADELNLTITSSVGMFEFDMGVAGAEMVGNDLVIHMDMSLPIPEPTTTSLGLAGLAALLLRRRRR